MWDTGSQVSVLLEEFLAHSFAEAQVRDISELVKGDLSLSAANGSETPYKGWTEVKFQATPQSQDLIIPFLVSPETVDYPLLGYSVIEEAVKLDHDVACPELLHESFPMIADDQLESLVNFIKSKHSDTELCSVRSDKNDAVFPKGTSVAISCRVNHGPIDKRTPVPFEPDQLDPWPSGLIVQWTLLSLKPGKSSRIKTEAINTTSHDIILLNRTPFARLKLAQSVTPVEVKLKEKVKSPLGESSVLETKTSPTSQPETTSSLPKHLADISLEGLTEEQKKTAISLLIEQQNAFAKDDDNVGSIPDLELNINLKDTTPVQKNNVAVPTPLHPEVKSYIEDLLNHKFIKKSTSSYSSPVVCVRKKDKSLRLCIDYRALNEKTIPDHHPIPRTQETLDSLGGNSWFSVLDQGKAYHQGFVTQ